MQRVVYPEHLKMVARLLVIAVVIRNLSKAMMKTHCLRIAHTPKTLAPSWTVHWSTKRALRSGAPMQIRHSRPPRLCGSDRRCLRPQTRRALVRRCQLP